MKRHASLALMALLLIGTAEAQHRRLPVRTEEIPDTESGRPAASAERPTFKGRLIIYGPPELPLGAPPESIKPAPKTEPVAEPVPKPEPAPTPSAAPAPVVVPPLAPVATPAPTPPPTPVAAPKPAPATPVATPKPAPAPPPVQIAVPAPAPAPVVVAPAPVAVPAPAPIPMVVVPATAPTPAAPPSAPLAAPIIAPIAPALIAAPAPAPAPTTPPPPAAVAPATPEIIVRNPVVRSEPARPAAPAAATRQEVALAAPSSASAPAAPVPIEAKLIESIFFCLSPGLPQDWKRAWVEVTDQGGGKEKSSRFRVSNIRDSNDQGEPLVPCNAEALTGSIVGLNAKLPADRRAWTRALLVIDSDGEYELTYDYAK